MQQPPSERGGGGDISQNQEVLVTVRAEDDGAAGRREVVKNASSCLQSSFRELPITSKVQQEETEKRGMRGKKVAKGGTAERAGRK